MPGSYPGIPKILQAFRALRNFYEDNFKIYLHIQIKALYLCSVNENFRK